MVTRTRLLGRLVVVTLLLALSSATISLATPSFARKYQASCQTCHIAYPKLNNFGQAFRLLGYRMPAETEAMVKVPDVSLGSEAYKRVWPEAVWPGAIPANVPIALAAQFLVQTRSRIEEENGEIERELSQNDFVFPSEVELIIAGSAGDHVSFFGEIEFEQESEDGEIHSEIEIGHVDVRFIRPIKNSTGFNVKIGSWQPELVSTFDHARRLTIANYDSMFSVGTVNHGGASTVGGGGHHGGGGVSLPAVARGVDMYGIFAHRFLWASGLMNGIEGGHESFDTNSAKDYYGRAAYKWGGLALDGANAADYAGSEKNWRENSLLVGVFGYWGDGEKTFFEFEEEDPMGMIELIFIEPEEYSRVGFDFNWFFKDLNVFGAYVDGEDDLRVFEESMTDPGEPGALDPDETGTFDYEAYFVEADVVLGMPWLHGAFRYENVDLPHVENGVPVEDWERATASLTGLVRANVKAIAEYTWDLNASKNYDIWLGAAIAY